MGNVDGDGRFGRGPGPVSADIGRRARTNAHLGLWCPAGRLPRSCRGSRGGHSRAGMGERMALLPPPARVPGEEAAQRGGRTAARSLRLVERSYFPCAADREFTFILVTGLFSFS